MIPAQTGKLGTMRPTGSSSETGQLYFTERGVGPPLLLVHGLMVSGIMFEPALDRFAAFHHVIVPNLRGHGRSRTLPHPTLPGNWPLT